MQNIATTAANQWLTRYSFTRAAFSLAWVAAAIALGRHDAMIAAVLLCLYPAWDAAANYLDAIRSGGLRRNPTQAINVAVSALTTVLVIVAVQHSQSWVLAIFGAWAIGAGVLQLATAVRRWKTHSGQWASVLSGAQSALAGAFFIQQSFALSAPPIVTLAGYAGVGAVYFLISATWLAVKSSRTRARQAAGA
ncbi:MAG TPA: DUF308 domain-containing protein [Ideonella sp.]|uniref:DUF308 domain-containing protein n=1 Tax=Ideonella sp. TaxID=1929293 RepID=UPI002CF42D9B|nr:DUF308 domain-containing protein [Ideonella sp.]HSI50245.1 DUF308 domain-containing protein [Ideonella sp.]